jgi:hypothetical protein
LPLLPAECHIYAARNLLGLDQILDQIILGAILYRAHRHLIVIQTCEHNDRDSLGALPHVQECLVTGTVRKVQVDQNELRHVLWDQG